MILMLSNLTFIAETKGDQSNENEKAALTMSTFDNPDKNFELTLLCESKRIGNYNSAMYRILWG